MSGWPGACARGPWPALQRDPRPLAEGVGPLQPMQRGAGMRPQRLAVGQQQVEGAVRGGDRQELAQRARQLGDGRHRSMRLGQLLHQPAEGQLAVGAAHGAEAAVQAWRKTLEVSVVRHHPVAAPELAHEGVGVLQRHLPLRGLADVGDDIAALDRVALHQLGHGRLAGAVVIDEQAQARVLEEGDAEAVLVLVGPRGQAGEGEHHVGGGVGIHAQQLAHRIYLAGTKSLNRPRRDTRLPGLPVSSSTPAMRRRMRASRRARQITRSASQG